MLAGDRRATSSLIDTEAVARKMAGVFYVRLADMTAVTIRIARASDAVEIARLTKQLGYDVTEAEVADRLSRILLRNDQQLFVADLDRRSVGWDGAPQLQRHA